MALESATYISDLNTSNPTATDNISEADDHLRLVKAAIKTTFPNITGAVTATHSTINSIPSSFFTMPSGSIIVYAGSSAPSGWLICDGSAISRSTYSVLFGIISTTYGVGDSSSTFNIPDLTGRVPVGKEGSQNRITNALVGLTSTALGNVGGSQGHTLTAAQSGVPAHTHGLTMNPHNHTFVGDSHSHTLSHGLDSFHDISGSTPSGNFASGQTKTTSSTQVSGTIQNSTSSGTIANNSTANASAAHPIVQPSIILNYCIKT